MGSKGSKSKDDKKKEEEELKGHGPRKCSKCYLMSLNTLMVTAGLVMIGLSAWLGTEYKGMSEMVSATVIWTPLGLGFGLIFVGLLGFFGALYANRCSLCMYIIFSAFLLVACMVMSIFLFFEIDAIQDAAEAPKGESPKDSDAISDGAVDDVNTFNAVTFNVCCFDQQAEFGSMLYEVSECPCTMEEVNQDTGCLCYNDVTTYDYYFDHFDKDFCDIMQDLTFVNDTDDKVPLVGATSVGGCGGGDPKQFQFNMADYAEQSLKPGAAAILITSIIMLVGVFFACFFFLLPERKKKEEYEQAGQDDEGPGVAPIAKDSAGESAMLQKSESDRLAERDDENDELQLA